MTLHFRKVRWREEPIACSLAWFSRRLAQWWIDRRENTPAALAEQRRLNIEAIERRQRVLEEQVCTDYGRRVTITPVRRFESTRLELGAGEDQGSWFVYVRDFGGAWSKHCGPYSDPGQAADWITAIREVPS